MIRLDFGGVTGEATLLRVAGRIVGADVGTFDRGLRSWLAASERVVLDLDDVEHVDPEGLQVLRRYRTAPLTLRGGSTYLRALLRAEGLIPGG